VACPRCATANAPGHSFCQACGARLSTPADPGAHRAAAAALDLRGLATRSALEGERKQVTVLFADIKGSMELLADRDPEAARALLDPVLDRMMAAVHQYEGTVNQVMGDGIMALFGAPLAHEDHAIRACHTALAMQASIAAYGEEMLAAHSVPVEIRIGLNSGEVVVRSIGSDLHLNYTAVGQTTHLAARMEQLAAAGSIRLTAETLRLVEGHVHVRPLGPVAVKGLESPIEVYELIGVAAGRTRLQAAAARGLTRFVGRQRELDALHEALEEAGSGRGQVVAVVGEPGVGKSRLVWEFTHSEVTRGWLTLETGAVSYGKSTAYGPVVTLLRAYFKVEERDDPGEIHAKVVGQALGLDAALETALPALLALLGAGEDAQWEALDPPQRRQRTLDALARLFLRESRVQPLLLVFEDLHWIDAESQAFLDLLAESLPDAPVLLVLNHRDEHRTAWEDRPWFRQLRIEPLAGETAGELLRTLLGDDPGLRPLARLLFEKTEGNPFFLEESVRELVETQALVGRRGAYRVARAPESIHVPPTVQAVLAARIDRLGLEDKRLLQSAAVIGKDVSLALLQAVADQDGDALGLGLSRLRAAEFLYETRLFPDREYTFKHALTHEVAYGSLLHERRRALHARVVSALEELHGERWTEHAETLGHHAVRGEVWGRAVRFLRRAGTRAAVHSACRAAVASFEQALGVLPNLPEGRERLVQAIDLRLYLVGTLWTLGELARALTQLREAEELAQTLGEPRRHGRVSALMSLYSWALGDLPRAVASGQRGLEIGERLGDLALQVSAARYLGQAYHTLGEFRRALEYLGGNLERLQGDLQHRRLSQAALPSVSCRAWMVYAAAELGELAAAARWSEEAVRLAEAADHPESLIHACLARGAFHLARGDVAAATASLERAVALCEVADRTLLFPMAASFLGSAHTLAGRLDHALPLLEQAVQRAEAIGLMVGHATRLTRLGEACLLGGRADEAGRLARRALEHAGTHGERGATGWIRHLLGEIAIRRPSPDLEEAARSYREALVDARSLGARPLAARCHLDLGVVARRQGKIQEARAELDAAAALFGEMGIDFCQRRTEALRRAPGGPPDQGPAPGGP
jgi:predicted ATPase/class 3 adenylate cyclase